MLYKIVSGRERPKPIPHEVIKVGVIVVTVGRTDVVRTNLSYLVTPSLIILTARWGALVRWGVATLSNGYAPPHS